MAKSVLCIARAINPKVFMAVIVFAFHQNVDYTPLTMGVPKLLASDCDRNAFVPLLATRRMRDVATSQNQK